MNFIGKSALLLIVGLTFLPGCPVKPNTPPPAKRESG